MGDRVCPVLLPAFWCVENVYVRVGLLLGLTVLAVTAPTTDEASGGFNVRVRVF